MTDTHDMTHYRTLDDAALNRVVVERLGYTARGIDDGWVLLDPDGMICSPYRREYINWATDDTPAHGYYSDTVGDYLNTLYYPSEADAFAAGPQYVTDLNLAWALPFNDIMLHRTSDGNSVTIDDYFGVSCAYYIEGQANPARAVVLAWLAVGIRGLVDSA